MAGGFDRSAYIGAFREEMKEHLQALAEGLMALEASPDDLVPVAEVFRRAHTIKGSARVMGLDHVADLAHAMEDLLDDLRSARLRASPPLLDALLAALDLLRDLALASPGGPSREEDLRAATRRLAAARSPGDSRAPSPGGDQARVVGRAMEPVDPGAEESPRGAADPATGSAAPIQSLVAPPSTDPRGDSTTEVATTRPVQGIFAPPSTDPTGPSQGPTAAAPADRRLPESSHETVRVTVERVDALLNLAGELVVLDGSRREWTEKFGRLQEMADSVAAAARKGDLPSVLERSDKLSRAALEESQRCRRLISREGELVRELHYQSSILRMHPVRTIFALAPRTARDLARDQGKEIEVALEGEDTEVDREVLERLKDPVLHLVRNAVDHGIEPPALRSARGKPRAGRIRLAARTLGEQAIVEVEDDGTGVDPRAVRAAAARMGLLNQAEAEATEESECHRLLFLPGFSTRTEVTDLSGRGVGLDVVKSQVDALKGTVRLESLPGRGTRVTLEVPITLAITRVVLFQVAGGIYAVRCARLLGIVEVPPGAVRTLQGRETIEVGGRTVPLVRMHRILGLEAPEPGAGGKRPALLLGSPEQPAAFVVDAVLGDDNVIAKPLGPLLRGIPNLAGGIILGSGQVALWLSVTDLLEAVPRAVAPMAPSTPARIRREAKRVLVADDSAITRELERAVLDAAGYQVDTAVDGQDALEKLRAREYALVVSDVQMPRLDGFQLASAVRADPALARIPIVIVSAKESDEDRRRGLEVGVQGYMGKGAFDQGTLLDMIEGLIG